TVPAGRKPHPGPRRGIPDGRRGPAPAQAETRATRERGVAELRPQEPGGDGAVDARIAVQPSSLAHREAATGLAFGVAGNSPCEQCPGANVAAGQPPEDERF